MGGREHTSGQGHDIELFVYKSSLIFSIVEIRHCLLAVFMWMCVCCTQKGWMHMPEMRCMMSSWLINCVLRLLCILLLLSRVSTVYMYVWSLWGSNLHFFKIVIDPPKIFLCIQYDWSEQFKEAEQARNRIQRIPKCTNPFVFELIFDLIFSCMGHPFYTFIIFS